MKKPNKPYELDTLSDALFWLRLWRLFNKQH